MKIKKYNKKQLIEMKNHLYKVDHFKLGFLINNASFGFV